MPSKAINYELGWKNRTSSGYLEATTFYIESSNEILPYELEAFPGRAFYRNAGATSRFGLELAGSYQWNKWAVQASMTQAQYRLEGLDTANEFEGKKIPGIPSSQFFLQVNFHTLSDWQWVMTGEHIGTYFANNSNSVEIQEFQKLRFQGQKSIETNWGSLDFFGGINNLLNITYYDNIRLNAFGGRFYEPAPGRNFYFGLSLGL